MSKDTESQSSISSMSLSIKNQTRSKFDNLLKAKKSVHLSKEQLLEATEERLEEIGAVQDDYILNKFFMTNETKAPIPKPRQRNVIQKVSPTHSQKTFEVTSPKILKEDFKREEQDFDTSNGDSRKKVNKRLVHKVREIIQNEEKHESESEEDSTREGSKRRVYKSKSRKSIEQLEPKLESEDHSSSKGRVYKLKSRKSIEQSKSESEGDSNKEQVQNLKSRKNLLKLKTDSDEGSDMEQIQNIKMRKNMKKLKADSEKDSSQEQVPNIKSRKNIQTLREKSEEDSSKDQLHKIKSRKSIEQQESMIESEDSSKKQKDLGRKKTPKTKREEEIELQELHNDEADSGRQYSYENILEIVVHKTDKLLLNFYVSHPVVKIHIVDLDTGNYFPKSDKSRPVVFFYETNNDYIYPVLTKTFNLQQKRILQPSWEESVLFSEDYEYFKNERKKIILFFEILDFLPVSSTLKESEKGWHNIAFAFLKLSGDGTNFNEGQQLRLQLYYSRPIKSNTQSNIWYYWKTKQLDKYPSSLYITIQSCKSPQISESLRSKTPSQREIITRKEIEEHGSKETILKDDLEGKKIFQVKKDKIWSRDAHENCKIPNECLGQLNVGEEGCFVMKFSNNGLFLACANTQNARQVVTIFSVLTLSPINEFSSQDGFIYALTWAIDDSFLLSASSNNTISIFNLQASAIVQVLPHPSYVYSCAVSPEYILSGCHDGAIRIWTNKNLNNISLFQELESHKGYITSMVLNKKKSIFSADSTGVILEWQQQSNGWILKREISILDLNHIVINQLILFPKERRLLVFSRDNTIRIIDVKTGCVLHWLKGAVCKRMQSFAALSSCGTFIYSGSENGYLYVWDSKSGQEIRHFNPYGSSFVSINCVEHHPLDNILALAHFGDNVPVLVYNYTKTHEDKEEIRPQPYKKKEVNTIHEKVDYKRLLTKIDAVVNLQKQHS